VIEGDIRAVVGNSRRCTSAYAYLFTEAFDASYLQRSPTEIIHREIIHPELSRRNQRKQNDK
jgi:hypothetical protein